VSIPSRLSAREAPNRLGGSRGSVALVSVLLVSLVFASVAYGAGQLDPSFDGDGKVVTNYGANEVPLAVATQGDGKIVVAGQRTSNEPDPYNPAHDFMLVRYTPEGSVDPSFDDDGMVVTDLGGQDVVRAVSIQSDGKIVAAGYSDSVVSALARYNPDGSLDASFDGDGKVFTQGGAATALAIQDDGKLVVAGTTGLANFAVNRYNADGSLDPTFGGDGKVTTGFGAYEAAYGVAIHTDGKIVVAGLKNMSSCCHADFALARYNTDGTLDTNFDGDGRVVTDVGPDDYDEAFDVALQRDGKIVASGISGSLTGDYPSNFALARYNTNGSVDGSFDGDGRVVTDFGASDDAQGVEVQDDGKIVAAGSSRDGGGDSSFALARYNTDGSLDSSFDVDGRALTHFGSSFDEAYGQDVTIQADGRIVAVGFTSAGSLPAYNLALARYIAVSPAVSVNDVSRLEGNAGATAFAFTISLSGPSSQTVRVTAQTANGSAAAGSDYTALGPVTFTFSPGQTTKTAIVNVKGEVAIEPHESFFLNLSNPANATIGDGQGTGTILNDDLSDNTPCTITGTSENDVLTGTPSNDVICGGKGDDQIYGVGGADVLKGEDGNDLLIGGNGVDLLLGARGADDLSGESGNDTLRAGDGVDALNGGADSDALFGDARADSLNTQDGVSANDSADGGSDSDSCVFDSGDFVTSCP
jgi:uncharacterized delta-60 repeat protein